MQSDSDTRAWLLMVAGDSRGYGGNSGYDDQFDAYYSWDSNVPNHKRLSVGDAIALWDKEELLGASVIEHIDKRAGIKQLNRCPRCGVPQISERKKRDPRYRCTKCTHEFDVPRLDNVNVDLYRARYDAAWTPLSNLITRQELISAQEHLKDQNAMRPFDWEKFESTLERKGASLALHRIRERRSSVVADWTHGVRATYGGGFVHRLVRVRRGQEKFRQRTLRQYGNVCALTGAAPERVLDAGHLYSYAKIGEHHEHGGLMLRKDLHRLFDDGLILVNPTSLTVSVAPELVRFDQYAILGGRPLQVNVNNSQIGWLRDHWIEHQMYGHR